jgi:hypothetical protein
MTVSKMESLVLKGSPNKIEIANRKAPHAKWPGYSKWPGPRVGGKLCAPAPSFAPRVGAAAHRCDPKLWAKCARSAGAHSWAHSLGSGAHTFDPKVCAAAHSFNPESEPRWDACRRAAFGTICDFRHDSNCMLGVGRHENMMGASDM